MVCQEECWGLFLGQVQAHNELNGFRFSAIEFTLIALVVLPFGLYYVFHVRFLASLVAIGA